MEKLLCFLVLAISGAKALLPETRIVGGQFSRENEFPFAVSLQENARLDTLYRGHTCGGVLISPSYVLTTAYCTYTYNQTNHPVAVDPNFYRAFAGSVNLQNHTSPDRFRMVVNITRHPEYTGHPAYANNIAILGLNNPFDRAVATPLSLPPQGFNLAEGSLCVVVGWGSENTTENASVYQKYARKYISNHNICTLQYAINTNGINILPSMICAQSFDITSTGCTGDNGNGLICNGGLAGILMENNRCLSTGYPEVYTRVSNYTTWIRSVTGAASTFQPGVAALIMLAITQLITAKVIS